MRNEIIDGKINIWLTSAIALCARAPTSHHAHSQQADRILRTMGMRELSADPKITAAGKFVSIVTQQIRRGVITPSRINHSIVT